MGQANRILDSSLAGEEIAPGILVLPGQGNSLAIARWTCCGRRRRWTTRWRSGLPEEGILYGGAATPGDMIPTIGTPLLGGIPAKVAVGGASAGGCIAAAMTLMARDRNGPTICHQHLLIPVIDDRLETPSAQRIHDPRVWNRANADAAWRLYLGPTHTGTPSPYAAPGRAEDLSGLPPATVLVEEMDLLRDAAVAYAGRLTAAGALRAARVFRNVPRPHGVRVWCPDQAALDPRLHRRGGPVLRMSRPLSRS